MLNVLNSITLKLKVKCMFMELNRKKRNKPRFRNKLNKDKIISKIRGLMINLMILSCFVPLKINFNKDLKFISVMVDYQTNYYF